MQGCAPACRDDAFAGRGSGQPARHLRHPVRRLIRRVSAACKNTAATAAVTVACAAPLPHSSRCLVMPL
jgi:hypothetical protein